jgi:ABC-2 type transport system ATP-binding protein
MLEAVHLTRRFGDRVAVDDASLAVEPGRLTGFVGANGAGKTTTLRMLAGITSPDAGEVRWGDRPARPGDRARCGYLPEQRGLYARMRVREQLVYLARLHGRDTAAAQAAAARWMLRLGLEQRAGDRIQDLSHGNQQRVQLAAALVHEPDLLLLDEPFSGLDPVGVELVADVLRECAGAGVGVLLSCHQLELVESLCDAVYIIDAGRIVASGTIDEIVSAAGRRLVVEVEGAPARWAQEHFGPAVMDVSGDRVCLRLGDEVDPRDVLDAAMRAGQVVHFVMQPARLSEIFLSAVAA